MEEIDEINDIMSDIVHNGNNEIILIAVNDPLRYYGKFEITESNYPEFSGNLINAISQLDGHDYNRKIKITVEFDITPRL